MWKILNVASGSNLARLPEGFVGHPHSVLVDPSIPSPKLTLISNVHRIVGKHAQHACLGAPLAITERGKWTLED